jgi:hypothetical protein
MLKHLILLTVLGIVQSICPLDQPSCLFQIQDPAPVAAQLWNTTSCTSYATWLFFVYEQVGSSNVITKVTVGTSDPANYTLETADF